MTAITGGQTLVFPSIVDHFDADDVVATVHRWKVPPWSVVGDALVRPLVAALKSGDADVSSLAVLANGGAMLTPSVKEQVVEVLPNATVIDAVGSSETGAQMHHLSTSGAVSTGTFAAGPDTCVVAEDLGSILEPAQVGRASCSERCRLDAVDMAMMLTCNG